MNCKEQCFGCHGLYDVDDDIASSRRSSLDALTQDPEVEESDISAIQTFYDIPCIIIFGYDVSTDSISLHRR